MLVFTVLDFGALIRDLDNLLHLAKGVRIHLLDMLVRARTVHLEAILMVDDIKLIWIDAEVLIFSVHKLETALVHLHELQLDWPLVGQEFTLYWILDCKVDSILELVGGSSLE